MGNSISTDASWSLGSAVDARYSDGQVLELCGASHRVEAAYQRWLNRQQNTLSQAQHTRGKAPSAGKPPLAAHPSPDSAVLLDFSILGLPATPKDASPASSLTGDGVALQLLIDFERMSGQLVLPMPFAASDAQLRAAVTTNDMSNGKVTASSVTTASVTSEAATITMAPTASVPSCLPMGRQPPRFLLRNGVPPAIPADLQLPKRHYRGLAWWLWFGRGSFRDYSRGQRARLEQHYQAYLAAKDRYHLCQADPKATTDELSARLAHLNKTRTVTLRMQKHTYHFNFEAMTQSSARTNRVRPIRRLDHRHQPPSRRPHASQQHPLSTREGDLVVLASLGDGDTVPLWKWENSKGRAAFEPYTPTLCAEIERLYQRVLADVDVLRKEHGDGATVDPKLYQRTLRMLPRAGARRRMRFTFIFENPQRFQQVNPRSLLARTIVRTLVPRTAMLELIQVSAAAKSNTTTTTAESAPSELPLLPATATNDTGSPQNNTDARETVSDGEHGKQVTQKAFGLSEQSVTSRNRIASAWGCDPTLLDTMQSKPGTTVNPSTTVVPPSPTIAPTTPSSAAEATVTTTAAPTTERVRWQYGNSHGRAWRDMRPTDKRVMEGLYKAYTEAKHKLLAGDWTSKPTEGAAHTGTTTAGQATPSLPEAVQKGIRCGRQHYTLNFDAMTQLNETTGKTRPLRRKVAAPPDSAEKMSVAPVSTATVDVTATQTDEGANTEALVDVPADSRAVAERENVGPLPEEDKGPRGDGSTYLGRGRVDPRAGADLCARCVVMTGPATDVGGAAGVAAAAPYMCMLNKADIKANNNKFYFMQLLQAKGRADEYHLHTRWGRVGHSGSVKSARFSCAEDAVRAFERTFSSKTGNRWTDRKNFKLHPGMYMLMRIDNRTDEERDAEDGPVDQEQLKKITAAAEGRVALKSPQVMELPSQLPPLVRNLMTYLTDRRDMNSMMSGDFSLDVKRMPLGRITKDQIKDAFAVLTKIEDALKGTGVVVDRQLVELSNMFYTLLPHIVPTHSRLPAIDNTLILQKKIDLVQTLGDIEIANAIMKRDALSRQQLEQQMRDGKPIQVQHHLDKVYASLRCDIAPLDPSDAVAQRIQRYAELTCGTTHSMVPHVEQIFTIRREGEEERWAELCKETAHAPAGPQSNVRMLWHGSRKTNFLGILSQGLRIAPPEAPSTGYMFGKGIYFADVVSKASGYCHPINHKGLMLLSEVGLGRMLELGSAQYMEKPKHGFYSTKGVGRMAPDGKEVHDGVRWAMGSVKDQKHPRIRKTSLYYPEYIIYDPRQYRMKYLVQMCFRHR